MKGKNVLFGTCNSFACGLVTLLAFNLFVGRSICLLVLIDCAYPLFLNCILCALVCKRDCLFGDLEST